ncbi:MAG: hypothetical protein Satyrvirus8_9 [Satyrvirus sp.]|uniref:Uncharacterized protein n=1 Tax=Satyrvirus sp. TaxID=2487771 RepID=A0A3G5AG45_9VIRU|nr:MAG: hypothetical protein Satyrvirus8_9 [Satyrvirus sp.]
MCEETLNCDKILSVTARHSIFYLNYPYVMEIEYDKIQQNVNMIPIYVGKIPVYIPISVNDPTTIKKYKYQSKDHLLERIEEIKKLCKCKVINKL